MSSAGPGRSRLPDGTSAAEVPSGRRDLLSPRYVCAMRRHQAGRSCATAGSDVRTATTAPPGSVSIASRRSINRPVPTPSAPPSTRAAGSGKDSLAMIASYQPLAGEALLLDGVEEDAVAGHHVRRRGDPALEPFQVHQFAPARVVVAHGQERLGPPPPAVLGEFREDREVTVAV